MSKESTKSLYNDEVVDDVKKEKKTENLRTIKSKYEITGNKGHYYTKTQKLSFPIKKLSFKNIPVLKSVKLSFFEKYTILLLQTGVVAEKKEELVAKISDILNVSERCITEFIDYLNDTNAICFDEKKKVFKLDETLHYRLDPNMNNAMFANFDVKQADCEKVVFVEGMMTFLLESDFPDDVFTRKGDTKEISGSLPYSVQNMVNSKSNILRPLFERYFTNNSMHLIKDFTYELRLDKYSDYNMEFDAVLEYKYDETEGNSVRQKTIVPKQNILSDEYIDALSAQFDFDNSLPKFIKHRDFYEAVDPKLEEMHSIKEKIDRNKEETTPLDKEIKLHKADLRAIEKTHKRELSNAQNQVTEIREKIRKTEEQLSGNQAKINDAGSVENDKIKSLEAEIKALKESKADLSSQLKNQEDIINDLTQKHNDSETQLRNRIQQREVELEIKDKENKHYMDEYNTLSKEYKALINTNKSMLNPVIRSVIEKYPDDISRMNYYISKICYKLDKCISASEYEAYDDIAFSMGEIRDNYRKLLQRVFDVCLKNKQGKLGLYLIKNINEIEIVLGKRNVAKSVSGLLPAFHDLINAMCHSTEEGYHKEKNEIIIQNFKNMTDKEREELLLVVPNIFKTIKFTEKELSQISENLGI